MGAIARYREAAGTPDDAIGHFLKVTRSYRSGLFACYDTVGLPRTDNDLEQLLGSPPPPPPPVVVPPPLTAC